MATTTANLGLTKPDYTEAADIAVINNNMEIIDDAMHDAAISVQQRDRVEDLLINGNFVNPVNQRGRTSYTGAVYGIDRWIGRNALQTLEVRGPDVTITANSASQGWPGLRQKIANIAKYAGKTVTFAVRLYSSVGVYLRFTDTSSTNLVSSSMGANKTTETLVLTATVPDGATPDSFFPDILLAGSTSDSYMRLYWAALYVGEYTAETLPAYVPRGYAAELSECRRYFRRKEAAIVPTYVGANQSSLVFIIENDEPFRAIPNMNLEAISWIRGEGKNITTIPSWTVSRYTANNVNPSFSVEFGNSLGLSIYGAAFVYCAYSLDAEL